MPRVPVGAYRRSIEISTKADIASAEMEDDVHHFAVTIQHHNSLIVDVSVESLRTPWTTCAAAAQALARLVGRTVSAPIRFTDDTERYTNCTHMLDLANLALAHVDEPSFERRYDIEVGFPEERLVVASLDRDKSRLFDWQVLDGKIVGGPFDAQSPNTLLQNPDVLADLHLLEAVVVLRRALHIARWRSLDLDSMTIAEDLGPLQATCHTLLPAIRPLALRNRGTARDFSGEGRWPLS